MRSLIVAVLLVWTHAVLGADVMAGAFCVGPSIDFPRQADRGGSLLVTGEAWGDDCNDVGPLPSGVGVLGRPASDVELVVVQGASEWVVGRASADAEYRFAVTVTVPPDAQPGPARLIARYRGNEAYSADPTLAITAVPVASTSTSESVSTPSSSALTSSESGDVAAASRDSRSSAPAWGWIFASLAMFVSISAGVGAIVTARRKAANRPRVG